MWSLFVKPPRERPRSLRRGPPSVGGAVMRPGNGASDPRREVSPAAIGQGPEQDVPRPEIIQWRNAEFQMPSLAERSRHGAPIRAAQEVASSTHRWSRADLPSSGLADTMKGSKLRTTPCPSAAHGSAPISTPEISVEPARARQGSPSSSAMRPRSTPGRPFRSLDAKIRSAPWAVSDPCHLV